MADKQKEILKKLMDSEIQATYGYLKKLKDKSKHTEEYWNFRTHWCYKVAEKKFYAEEYSLSQDILLKFLELRPNFVEAYFYLARIYNATNEIEFKNSIYIELLKWTMGDWNTAMDELDIGNTEKAKFYLKLCIHKLDFFIDYVPEFYYAHKMRGKCYTQLQDSNKAKFDFDSYVNKAENSNEHSLPWLEKFGIRQND